MFSNKPQHVQSLKNIYHDLISNNVKLKDVIDTLKEPLDVEFGFDEYTITNNGTDIGYGLISNKFLGISAKGSHEKFEVYFILFYDKDGCLNGYVPKEGNTFNKKIMKAFGNETEEFETWDPRFMENEDLSEGDEDASYDEYLEWLDDQDCYDDSVNYMCYSYMVWDINEKFYEHIDEFDINNLMLENIPEKLNAVEQNIYNNWPGIVDYIKEQYPHIFKDINSGIVVVSHYVHNDCIPQYHLENFAIDKSNPVKEFFFNSLNELKEITDKDNNFILEKIDNNRYILAYDTFDIVKHSYIFKDQEDEAEQRREHYKETKRKMKEMKAYYNICKKMK